MIIRLNNWVATTALKNIFEIDSEAAESKIRSTVYLTPITAIGMMRKLVQEFISSSSL